MASDPNGRDDVILANKELIRQIAAMGRRWGEDAFNKALSSGIARDAAEILEKIHHGGISVEEAQAKLEPIAERSEEMARRLAEGGDNPSILMQMRAENEANMRQLSQIAQLLASDSVRAAGLGLSEEDRIDEVRRGHSGDVKTQLTCLQEIERLQRSGPWPWLHERDVS